MSKLKSTTTTGDHTPVAGGASLPAALTRKLEAFPVSSDELLTHICRLLALHPKAKKRFGDVDVASLDKSAQEGLLAEINRLLKIKPLGKRRAVVRGAAVA